MDFVKNLFKPYGKKQLSFRARLFGTALMLILYRALCHVPLPFVSKTYMEQLLSSNGSLAFFNVLTGGGFETMSLMALGISPYISASIVVQLMGMVIPRLAEMQKEGSTGKKQIERITLVLGAALGFLQAVCMMWRYGSDGMLSSYKWYTVLLPAVIMTVGVFVLSAMGQFITGHFFGNGISLILFTGIVASYLGDAGTLYVVLSNDKSVPVTVLSCALAVVAVFLLFGFTFFLNDSTKEVKVTYSRRIKEGYTAGSSIPLKLVPGSVVPIIFASSIITLPALIQTFTKTDVKWLWVFDSAHWFKLSEWWASIGAVLYCLMIIGFAYYYNALNLNENEIANNLKKHGGYVHGIRPGKPTADYLKAQMKYMTLLGALGLCVIAMVPSVLSSAFGISSLSFLGTSIIITVSVIHETSKSFSTEWKSAHYTLGISGVQKGGRRRGR